MVGWQATLEEKKRKKKKKKRKKKKEDGFGGERGRVEKVRKDEICIIIDIHSFAMIH